MNAQRKLLIAAAALCWVAAPQTYAKGLDDLSQNNPEVQGANGTGAASGSDAHEGGEAGAAAAPKKPEAPTAFSKAVTQTVFMGTSFGWVKASRSGGTWRSSGTSDLLVGYKLPTSLAGAALAGTYRYVPIAVSGSTPGHDYRGIWEMHYFGALANFAIKEGLSAAATAELGYGAVHLRATDGLPVKDADAKGGVSVAVGGGADWHIGDKDSWTAGPRIHVGLGSFTTVQVGGGASFMF